MDDLTPQELFALTGQRKPERQALTLERIGVPFRFGGGVVSVRRAVAEELPAWQAKAQTARPRLDLVR